ncbi:hypothetical protein [Gymnodinialimonas sp.]
MPLPIEYAISTELNVMLARWWGDVEIGEYRELFAAYLRDENYQVGRPEICDLSDVQELDADFARIWSILTMVNAQTGGEPVKTTCVIYAPNETHYGLARMYQSLAENADGIQVAVFRDEATAMAHLNLPGPSLKALRESHGFHPPTPNPDQDSP